MADAPTNVAAVNRSASQVLVSWVNAQTDHTNNHVEVSPDSGVSWYTADATGGPDAGTAGNVIAPTATSYAVTGYDNGGIITLADTTLYDFRVTALGTADSSPAEIPHEIYTMPNDTGNYWGALPGATEWTHILSLTGEAPFIVGLAVGLKPDTSRGRTTIPDPSVWEWGPLIDPVPAFPT